MLMAMHDVVEPGQGDVEHVAVEEQERAQRLVLRRGGDPALDRQRAQKRVTSGAAISAGWRLPWKKM